MFEILLTIALSSILAMGVFNIFFETLRSGYHLSQRSELFHQLLTGMEGVVTELQVAEPDSILFLEADGMGGYLQVQFLQYESSDLYWFYLNATGQLIRGVQRPGYDWGRTTIADHVTEIQFKEVYTLSGDLQQIELRIRSELENSQLEMTTVVSPGH